MWSDHPRVIIQPEEAAEQNSTNSQPIDPAPNIIADPEPPPAPNIESEGASSDPAPATEPRRSRRLQENSEPQQPRWEREPGGRLRKLDFASMSPQQFNMIKSTLSKKDRKLYYALLCAKPPPQACRLSRKKLKRRQKMKHRREEGNRMLSAMHFDDDEKPLTVDAILSSPISTFIHLASNNCGYNGSTKELICKWVHLFFLKAKSAASKEDNPNWWQAMSGPFADDYWRAAVTEIGTLESMRAWDIVDRKDDMNIIDSTWAFKLKRYPDGLIKKLRPAFVHEETSKSKEWISLKHTHLSCSGQPYD